MTFFTPHTRITLSLFLLYLAFGGVFLGLNLGCSSTRAQRKEAARLLEETCSLYQENRDTVLKLREYAIVNQDKIPPSVWALLVKLDKALPILDAAGRKSCDYAALAETFSEAEVRGWRDALIFLLQVAADLKRSGAI